MADFEDLFGNEPEVEFHVPDGKMVKWNDLTQAQQASVDGADQADNFLVLPDDQVMPIMRLWEEAQQRVSDGHMAEHLMKGLLASGLVKVEAKPGATVQTG